MSIVERAVNSKTVCNIIEEDLNLLGIDISNLNHVKTTYPNNDMFKPKHIFNNGDKVIEITLDYTGEDCNPTINIRRERLAA